MNGSLRQLVKKSMDQFPVVGPYFTQIVQARLHRQRTLSGHFSSPVPNIPDVKKRAGQIFNTTQRQIPGINLNSQQQLQLLQELAGFIAEQPFLPQPQAGQRYHFENRFFSYADALALYGLLRHFQPSQIIEVGSGYSSFVMLDTDEQFLDRSIQLTFIEPFDERLKSRLKPEDEHRTTIINQFVQDVPMSTFEKLKANDILFIDSSHISKIGSDVNFLFFDVLPRLANGVIIHFHDILYPFEYPQSWFEQRHYWNEAYLLRAFLQFNTSFEILLWNNMLGLHYPQELEKASPLSMKDIGGSIWLRKTGSPAKSE